MYSVNQNVINKLKNQYSKITSNIIPNSTSKSNNSTNSTNSPKTDPDYIYDKPKLKKSKKGFHNTKKGIFTPKNPDKFFVVKNKQNNGKITYRSSWEEKFMEWCDRNPFITKVISEGLAIPYIGKDNKWHKYYPDFLLKYKDDIMLIEIKPKSLTEDETNKRKFAAALKWSEQKNIKFIILTENELKSILK